MSMIDPARRLLVKLASLVGFAGTAFNASAQDRPLRLPFAPTPSNGSALASRAVESVRDVDGIVLDYSPSSLKHIDRIVLGFHSRGLRFNEVGETVFVFGCYVGEVIVRTLGARWEMPDEEGRKLGFSMMGVRLKDGAFLNPIGKSLKLLQNGSEDSVEYFYQALATPKK